MYSKKERKNKQKCRRLIEYKSRRATEITVTTVINKMTAYNETKS